MAIGNRRTRRNGVFDALMKSLNRIYPGTGADKGGEIIGYFNGIITLSG
jgi:hypothetical protein